MTKLTSLMKNGDGNVSRDAAVEKRCPGSVKDAERKRTDKRAGEILKESEAKYRSLFEQTMDAVMITDMETDVILEANGACAAMFGYPREQLTGMPHHALQPEDKKDGYKKHLNERLQKETTFTEILAYRCADGKEIRINVSTTILNINGKRVMQSIFREMTERNSLLKKMMESEEKFSRAFQASPDAISISDFTDGRFIEVNESFTRITGYTREELLNRSAENFNMWATEEDRKKMLEPLERHERLRNVEIGFRVKDGGINTMLTSSELIQISGKPCLLVVSTDITERKKIEQAQKESEEKFTQAFYSSPAAMCIFTVEDSKFSEVNDSYTRFTGYSREELIGRMVDDFNLFVSQEEKENMAKSLEETGTLVNLRIRSRMKSGEIRTGLFTGQAFTINNQKRLILTINDITDQAKAQEAIANEATLRHVLIHDSSDGIVILDSDGKVYEANKRFAEMLGYSPEEMTGLYAWDWEYQYTREQVIEMLRTVDQSGDHFETHHRRQDGTIYDVEISTNGAIINGKKLIFCVCRDITQRKQIENALKSSEEKVSKAFRAIPEAIAISRVKDGVFVEANDNFCRVVRRTRDEVIGHTNIEIGIVANPGQREEIIKTIQTQGGITNKEININAGDGNIRTTLFSADIIDIGGEPCVISVSTDITERKRMEQTMADEAVRRRILIEQSRDGIVIIDQTGKVYEANRRFAEIHGYTPEEVSKLHIWDWEKSLPPEQLLENVQIRDERGANFEARHYRKDGSVIDVEVSSNGTTYAGQKLVFSVIRDISERKRMEQSRSDDAVRRRLLIEQSKDGIVIMDQAGAVYEANRRFVEMHGYTPEEIVKLHIWDWEKSIPREQLLEVLQKRDHEGVSFETRHYRKDGSIIDVEVSSNGAQYAGQKLVFSVVRDISERKGMEKALRESEEKFSKAIDVSGSAICIMSLPDNKFVEINKGYTQFTGYTAEEVIGRTPTDLNLWVDDKERGNLQDTLKKGNEFHNQEFHSRMKSGEIRIGLSSAEVINIGGKPHRLNVIQDITEIRKAEEKIRESEEKFSKAFQTIPESISISRLKDDIFIDVNDSFCRNKDLTREQIVGHSAVELGLWTLSGGENQIIGPMKGKAHVENIEHEFKNKKGEVHTVLLSADTFNINGEPHMVVIGNDISERKRMEQTLRESEEKFSKIFSTSSFAIGITSLASEKFIEVNDAFCRFTGYSREETIGHRAAELNLWVKPEELAHWAKTLTENGRAYNVGFTSRMKSGEIRVALASAEVINIGNDPCRIIMITDITDLKRAQEKMAESEEKFSKAFHSIPESVSIVTENGGIYIDVNESFLRSNQFTREQVIGHSAVELKIGNSTAIHEEMVRSVREHGSIVNEERQLITESGEELTLLFSANMIQIAGKPCIITISNNITSRKQMEVQLKKALAELQTSSAQLRATNKELESFSYSVSHDLRSPLRSIDGFSQALLEDYAPKLDETARDYLNRMRSASQKMGELIDGLLKLSRLTRNDMHYEAVDLSALVQDIAARLQETDPERKAEFIITPGLKTAGDAQMLRVMLENLVGNAWKFTRKVPQARIEFGSSVSGGEETFFIKDNGAGFDMAYRDKLFGAFQRLHDTRDFPGTGIGLATVQRIINRHGGAIRAEGIVGQGAAFYFSL